MEFCCQISEIWPNLVTLSLRGALLTFRGHVDSVISMTHGRFMCTNEIAQFVAKLEDKIRIKFTSLVMFVSSIEAKCKWYFSVAENVSNFANDEPVVAAIIECRMLVSFTIQLWYFNYTIIISLFVHSSKPSIPRTSTRYRMKATLV